MEIDRAFEDIDDLLVRMGMRRQRVARRDPVQRQGGALAGEGLALDAGPDRSPLHLFPIDAVRLHGGPPQGVKLLLESSCGAARPP